MARIIERHEYQRLPPTDIITTDFHNLYSSFHVFGISSLHFSSQQSLNC
jgi:hypothetical protein